MGLLQLLLLCVVVCWTECGVVVAPEDGFPAAVARLLQGLRMPAARTSLVPAVLTDLKHILQPRFPGCETTLYGSLVTGLATIHSDIDVGITFLNPTNVTPTEFVLQAKDIMLQHQDLFQVVNVVLQAKVPVVNTIHLPTGFSVEVSYSSIDGITNSKLVRYFMALDERARDLVLILKHWARVHEITRPPHTILSGYGIATMAIFLLQQREILPTVASLQNDAESFVVDGWNMGFKENKYETRNNDSLCEILGDFFVYYNEFDYKKYMVSAFVGRPVQIELFKDLDTVPDEFGDYKNSVRLNIKQPLNLQTPIVQEMFQHNRNTAYRLNNMSSQVKFVTLINNAASKYQKGCSGFLEELLVT